MTGYLVRLLILVLLLGGPAWAAMEPTDPEPAIPGRLTPAEWEQDIDVLVQSLRETHPDLVASGADAGLDRAARQLKSQLGDLDRNQAIAGMFKIMAMARDDSTYIYPFQDSVHFGLYPLLAYWFSDGLYVIDAHGEAEAYIGHRITQIGALPVDQAFIRLSPYLSGENMQGKRFLFTRNVFIPELLYAAGLSDSAELASFTFVSPDGVEETVPIYTDIVEPWKSWGARVVRFDDEKDVFARHADDAFWFEYLPETSTLFVRVTRLRDQENETLEDFAARLSAFADTEEFDRVVVDARYGGGGSGHQMAPLVEVITMHPNINRSGRLFGIIGRVTSGTVLEFVSVLQNNSRILLVGESTLDAPNGVGDPTVVTLPNSGIEIAITEVFWPTSFADDPRRAVAPDVAVNYQHSDWRQGRDPAITAVMNYQLDARARQPIASNIVEQLPGEYEVGPGQTMVISHNGNTLSFAIRDSSQEAGESFFRARSDLHAQNETRLRSDIPDVFIEFQNADGQIGHPILIWRGVAKPLQRVAEPADGGDSDAQNG